MEALKILIVEDDIFLGNELAEQLLDFGYIITDTVTNSKDAILAFRKRLPDLVLCDIQLEDSEKDGIEVAEVFNEIAKIPLIFLTAFSDPTTVARAKKVNPAYYLIKPCNPSQLKVAIDFALLNFSTEQEASPEHSLKTHPTISHQIHSLTDSFFIKDGNKYVRLHVSDILWVEAFGANVKIFTKETKFVLTANLSSFAKQMPHEFLMRLHRSYIVNVKKIQAFQSNQVYLNYAEKEKEKTS